MKVSLVRSLDNGVEHFAIYMNNTRIAGEKPLVGNKIVKEWDVTFHDVAKAAAKAAECPLGSRCPMR